MKKTFYQRMALRAQGELAIPDRDSLRGSGILR
jgi:hypothetical protein